MKSLPSLTPLLVLCLFLGLCIVPFNCEETEAVNKNDITSKVHDATLATNKDNIKVPLENTTQDGTVTTQSSGTASSSGTPLPETTTILSTTPIGSAHISTTPTTTTTPISSITPPITTPSTTTPTTTPTTTTPTTTTTTAPTTTIAPPTSTTAPITTTTVAPNPAPCHRFDGPSFIGGIVLTLGLLAIGVVAYKFYKARNERNYQTL